MTVVAIDAFHLRPEGKGVARVLANLTPYLLARQDERIRYMAFATRGGVEILGSQYAGGVVVVPEILDSLWVHQALPIYARRAGADLLYLHREVGPFWGPPYILHIYEDPTARWARIPPGAWRTKARAVLDRMTMRRSIRRARAVATSTDATARELAGKFGIARHHLAVVPLGVDPAFPREVYDRSPRKRRHIFHLGSEDARDNTLAVLRAYAWLQAHRAEPLPLLVVAGGLGALGATAAALASSATPGSVSILGRVSDGELYSLYREAVVCVQPSSDEGFGLQPLEAMASGTPVIALDTPAAREVLGRAAYLVPSSAPEVLGMAIDRLLSEHAYREELQRRGLERSGLYTWNHTANLIHTLVEKALASLAGRHFDPVDADWYYRRST